MIVTLCGSFFLFGLVQLVLAGIAGLSADMTRVGDVLRGTRIGTSLGIFLVIVTLGHKVYFWLAESGFP